MPGDEFHATCPCGYNQIVSPGILGAVGPNGFLALWVAYDPDRKSLLTVDSEEARARHLRIISGNELRVEGKKFDCPECGAQTLSFQIGALWD
jgi:hypothetical protein